MASVGSFSPQKYFIVDARTYLKDCPVEKRWDFDVSEELSGRIAAACKDGYVNIRLIQGSEIDILDGKIPWYGDHLGAVASGLSRGHIQVKEEDLGIQVFLEDASWTPIPRNEAIGWREVKVVYVYSKVPSERMKTQVAKNPSRMLLTAKRVYQGQFVAVIKYHTVVVADRFDDLYRYLKNPSRMRIL